MMVYRCDGCGKEMTRRELRYAVSVEVHAAYGELEISLADLVRDHRSEIVALIERMKQADARVLEEQVYKHITLDLCPVCQRAFIKHPLHFHPERGGETGPVDVDGFLRSLGLGAGPLPEQDEL